MNSQDENKQLGRKRVLDHITEQLHLSRTIAKAKGE